MVPARSRLPRLGGYGWRGQVHAASQPPWPSGHSAHYCGVTGPQHLLATPMAGPRLTACGWPVCWTVAGVWHARPPIPQSRHKSPGYCWSTPFIVF